MTIHKEGHRILLLLALGLIALSFGAFMLAPPAFPFVFGSSLLIYLLVLQFFRSPQRQLDAPAPDAVYAPADGKVVVIEEVEETEYFQTRRLQISIFMSIFNVHVNRAPFGGEVVYYRHHPGKYLAAWHPKSSTDNERATTVIRNGPQEVLVRQIAGAVARRIKNYFRPGQGVKAGEEMGFIKFGSRVDILLPPDAEVAVELGQEVRWNRTVLARLEGKESV